MDQKRNIFQNVLTIQKTCFGRIFISDLTQEIADILQYDKKEENEKIVVKVSTISKISISDQKKTENPIHEIAILQHLKKFRQHPNIAEYLGYFKTNSKLYNVFKYFPSMDLFDFFQKLHTLKGENQQFSKDLELVVKYIGYEILQALEFLHDHNICHFDISLENVLIDQKSSQNIIQYFQNQESVNLTEILKNIQIRLIDFGAAQILQDISHDDYIPSEKLQFLGKIQYKCPELAGNYYINPFQNDIYQFGMLLCFALLDHFLYNKPFDENCRQFQEDRSKYIHFIFRHFNFHFSELCINTICDLLQTQQFRPNSCQIIRNSFPFFSFN